MARLITHEGVTLSLSDWAAKLGISPPALWHRLPRMSIERALTPGPLERHVRKRPPGNVGVLLAARFARQDARLLKLIGQMNELEQEPTIRNLSRPMGLTRPTTTKYLQRLEGLKLIRIRRPCRTAWRIELTARGRNQVWPLRKKVRHYRPGLADHGRSFELTT